MRYAMFLAAALAAAGCAPAPAAVAPGTVQVQLAGLESQLAGAIITRDTAVFHRLLAEDFALVAPGPDAASMPRAAWMSVMLERLAIDSASVSDVRVVEVAGDTAQVDLSFYWKGRAGEQAVDQSMRLRDVWVRRGGSWRMVLRRPLP